MDRRRPFHGLLLFVLQILLALSPVMCWDGVVMERVDYQGLEALKLGLVDPRGLLRSWNNGTGRDPCSGAWTGIKCAFGKVVAVQLPWSGLGGSISEHIGELTALRRLSLHDNAIGGEIPASISLLRLLRGVYLFNNRFSGTIPPSIGDCSMLQTLDASNNSLSGSIPSSIANNSRLYRLNLRRNDLSGSVPSTLAALSSLSFLILSKNHFDGSIPATVGNMSSLQHLDLAENNFTGEIPASVGGLLNLSSFNVSYNSLSGTVPSLLAEKFNSSSFAGNLELCGFNGSNPCPSSSYAPVQSQPTTSPSAPAASQPRNRRMNAKELILTIGGIVLLFLLLIGCVLASFLLNKDSDSGGQQKGAAAGVKPGSAAASRGKSAGSGGEGGGKLVLFDGHILFTADDLLCATAEVMGKSTYGTVYKATLEDGSHVAVKRLREKNAKSVKEFEAAAAALGKIRHGNLLPLRAYYLGPKGEKLLVFDYLPNGSFAAFFHARGPGAAVDWATRIRIATGVTRGLQHLHADAKIIHGNLSGSNVLLDDENSPKISEYGLPLLMSAAANSNAAAAAASLGYRAPELSKQTRKANAKADVYSLGIILLELLTGKSPAEGIGDRNLPQWAASVAEEAWTNGLFDLELVKEATSSAGSPIGDELTTTMKLALRCVDPSPAARPEVREILQQLEQIQPGADAASSSYTTGEGSSFATVTETTATGGGDSYESKSSEG